MTFENAALNQPEIRLVPAVTSLKVDEFNILDENTTLYWAETLTGDFNCVFLDNFVYTSALLNDEPTFQVGPDFKEVRHFPE